MARPERVSIERTPSGRRQFVISRSNSHHHHKDYVKLNLSEYEGLLDQIRVLQASNDNLTRENYSLKTNQQGVFDNYHGVFHQNETLSAQYRQLYADYETVNRSLADAKHHFNEEAAQNRLLHREIKDLKKEVSRLKRENDECDDGRKCDTNELRQLRRAVRRWEDHFDRTTNIGDTLQRKINEQEELIARLERRVADQAEVISRQSERIDEERRQIQRLRSLLQRY